MKALFIGRFQPFHKGHESVIEFILNQPKIDSLIIAIGSSQYNDEIKNSKENIFTYEERKEMIKRSISKYKSRIEIIPLPDYQNDEDWVDHIKNDLPRFDILFANTSDVVSLLEDQGYLIEDFPMPLKYHAKDIRQRIKEDKKVEDMIPEETFRYLKDIEGFQRIKNN